MNTIAVFESDMKALIQSIQQYSPDPSTATKLIRDSDQIGEDLATLKKTTEAYKNYDTTEERYDIKLMAGLQDVLHTLVECKKSLDTMPKPDMNRNLHQYQSTDDKQDAEDTKSVLSYALKLSKFSKIPRTFDGMLLPNNFIWPGDDNMRRGNLAMASIIPDKIIQTENYGADYAAKVHAKSLESVQAVNHRNDTEGGEKENDNDNDNDSDDDEFMPDRSDTMSDKVAKPSTLAISGLDLLDSDED